MLFFAQPFGRYAGRRRGSRSWGREGLKTLASNEKNKIEGRFYVVYSSRSDFQNQPWFYGGRRCGYVDVLRGTCISVCVFSISRRHWSKIVFCVVSLVPPILFVGVRCTKHLDPLSMLRHSYSFGLAVYSIFRCGWHTTQYIMNPMYLFFFKFSLDSM